MNRELAQVLAEERKAGQVAHLRAHPAAWAEALRLAADPRAPQGWRAASAVDTCMRDNDARVRPAAGALLQALPESEDGHQRELIRLLLRLELDDEQEGTLFNACAAVWGDRHKQPGTRTTALRFVLKMAAKYPDLQDEVRMMTQEPFVRSLSPGIRRSLQKRLAEMWPGAPGSSAD